MTSRACLITLAGATFGYVTAETLPIGLVPQLSAGLHVRPGTVGLLVTAYAAVAGLLMARSAAATVTAVILWGAAFTAFPVTGQAAVLRVAPRSADTASALYVVAFQIGIGGGALAGSLLVDAGLLSALCVVGTALAAAGLLVTLAARRALPANGTSAARPRRTGR